jgi:hypothetical protein
MDKACNMPMRKKTNAYTVLVGKPKGKKPCATHLKRKDNIEMYYKETQWPELIWLRIVRIDGPL